MYSGYGNAYDGYGEIYMALVDVPDTNIKAGDTIEKVCERKIGAKTIYLFEIETDDEFIEFEFSCDELSKYFFKYNEWSYSFKEFITKKVLFKEKTFEKKLKLQSYVGESLFRKLYETCDITLGDCSGFKNEEVRYFNLYIVRYFKLIEQIDDEFLNVFSPVITRTLRNIKIVKTSSNVSNTLRAIKSSEKVFKELYETAKSMNEEMVKNNESNLLLLEFEKQIELSSSFLNDLKEVDSNKKLIV